MTMKQVAFLCLLICANLVCAQKGNPFYTITGQQEAVPDSAKVLVLCYDQIMCHDCFIAAAAFCNEYVAEHMDVQFVIMVKGMSLFQMRSATSDLLHYFAKQDVPKVVYDLNPKERKRLFRRYKVNYAPCLFVFSSPKDPLFIPYERLFEGDSRHLGISKGVETLIDSRLYSKKREARGGFLFHQ